MLQNIIPSPTAAIIDMDGVLWLADQPLCDLNVLFNKFQAKNIKITFATNNATKTTEEYVSKFNKLGTCINHEQIVSSAMATADLLKSNFPSGTPIHIMGSPALVSELAANGFHHTETNPQVVVVGMDRELTYQKLNSTAGLVRAGLPFYGTNPDVTYPTPDGLEPGAGACIAAVESSSGVKAIMAGKPNPFLFITAMQRMNATPENTLVIGDRYETDIIGGSRAGCKTALVLSGISTKSDIDNWNPKPDLVLTNIIDLFP